MTMRSLNLNLLGSQKKYSTFLLEQKHNEQVRRSGISSIFVFVDQE